MNDVEPTIGSINAALPAGIRVDAPLATGGQGTVFRGSVEARPAAIKLYNANQTLLRVDREVAALSQIRCANIAELLWSGDIRFHDSSSRVVATAMIEGTPLNKIVAAAPLADDQVVSLVDGVVTAIDVLWGLRIVHRDLKPSNIIVSRTGPVVIDLGLARHLSEGSITITGATWGTWGYMSPEQARYVKQLTCKSDLYALGIVALQCLLGRHPTGGDQTRLLAGGFSERLPPEAAASKCASVVRQLLAFRPTARPTPAQVHSMIQALA